MKFLSVITALLLSVFISQAQVTNFHNYGDSTITGGYINFSQYAGKKVMVVNTASYCTYTPQYEDLQALYDQYNQYNFEIIGFPCNDFAAQEPKPDSNIIIVCQNYNITFQMMSKVEIVTGDTAEVYKWLQRADLNGVSNAQVSWNFNKFLIDEAGNWVRHILSPVNPLDTSITNWIMSPSVVSSPAIEKEAGIEIKSSNPVQASIDLMIRSVEAEHYDINIYSNQGQLIGNIFRGNAENGRYISYPVESLSSGIYIVTVQTRHSNKALRFAVAH